MRKVEILSPPPCNDGSPDCHRQNGAPKPQPSPRADVPQSFHSESSLKGICAGLACGRLPPNRMLVGPGADPHMPEMGISDPRAVGQSEGTDRSVRHAQLSGLRAEGDDHGTDLKKGAADDAITDTRPYPLASPRWRLCPKRARCCPPREICQGNFIRPLPSHQRSCSGEPDHLSGEQCSR